jgi:hypothetical protein
MLSDELQKLNSLKEIKPNQNWVSFAKRDLFEKIEESEINSHINIFSVFYLSKKPVLAAIASFVFIMGIFGMAQASVPGDILYSVKKITEKGQSALLPADRKLAFEFKLVNERLNELNSIVNSNRTGKLASAVKEVNDSLNTVAGKLKGEKVTKEIVKETGKINEVRNQIEEVLAIRISSDDTNQAFIDYYKIATEEIINDLRDRELNDEQIILLDKAVLLYEEGGYINALEVLLNI